MLLVPSQEPPTAAPDMIFPVLQFWANTRFMPRYALKIEYDGTGFCGWQRQKDAPSVQGTVETALGKLEEGLEGVTAAGRTDTGVHALAQVAHVDMAREWDPFRLSEALNYHLKPNRIAVTGCAATAPDFSARFDATYRQYLFRLLVRRAPETHLRNLVWRVGHKLDVAAMAEAAQHLMGKHDFTTFRSTDCQAKSPIKTLKRLDVTQTETPYGTEISFVVGARSFLHNQVRSFVGTLERVGAGNWSPDQVRAALEAKDRAACGPVSPPQGLYLSQVDYPQNPFGSQNGA